MEKVPCKEHGSLCLLKTGVRDGPSKGKSFYVCAAKLESPCGFTLPVDLPASHCLQHGDFLVELQALVKQPDRGDYKLYFRCLKSKADGVRWCGRIPWQGQKPRELPRNENSQLASGNPLLPKPERNPFKILDENLEPSVWKQMHEERQERKLEEKLKAKDRILADEKKAPLESWRDRELPVGMKVKKTYERKRVDPIGENKNSEQELHGQRVLQDGPRILEKPENVGVKERNNNLASAGEVTSAKLLASSESKQRPHIPKSVPPTNPIGSEQLGFINGTHANSRKEGVMIASKQKDFGESGLKPNQKNGKVGECVPIGKATEPMDNFCHDRNQRNLKDGTDTDLNVKTRMTGEQGPKAEGVPSQLRRGESSSEPVKGEPNEHCGSGEAKSRVDLKPTMDHPESEKIASKLLSSGTIPKAASSEKNCAKYKNDVSEGGDASTTEEEVIFVSSKAGKAVVGVDIPRSAPSTVRTSGGTVQTTITSFPGFGPAAVTFQDPVELHNQLKTQLQLKKATLATVNIKALPDKGQRLLKQVEDLEQALGTLSLSTLANPEHGNDLKAVSQWKTTLLEPFNPFSHQSTMPVAKPLSFQDPHTSSLGLQGLSSTSAFGSSHHYSQAYGVNPHLQGLYGGRMTENRLCAVRNATSEAIDHLHKSLESCPSPESTVEDPAGLQVPLLLHQKQALAWLLWREAQKPAGGILADDMGLGKTLTMIALILAQKKKQKVTEKEDKKLEAWISKNDSSIVASRGTLIICPASLIHHWKKEVEKRVSSSKLRVYLFHGPNRERDSRTLAEYDIVVTTYSLVAKEIPVTKDEGNSPAKDLDEEDKSLQCSTLLRIAWARVILDEAHNIKNPKVQTSIAVCKLRAGARWAVTGTPIQNNLLDMYSLLKFLRCSPFDEFKLWKNQVDNGSKKGGERLNILTKSLLLRRTKDQLDSSGKPLVSLPPRRCEVHRLKLSDDEQSVYNVLFARSRSTLQVYLKRHEDKGQVQARRSDNPFDKVAQEFGGNPQVSQNSTQDPSQGSSTVHILSLLLRLRQCCCHLALLKTTLDQLELKNEGITLSLEEQLNALTLTELDSPDPKSMVSLNGSSFKADLFENTQESSKISCLLVKLKAIRSSPDPQKSVIVSQWTSMLKIVAVHLKRIGLSYATIDGSVNPKMRMDMVEEFNSNPKGPQVMLVSLCAGGVGLNLIGGNHLFLLDMHWNPALEDQACDRIYRVGQHRDVVIHRFVCEETVEEKITDLQERKKDLAKKVLSGTGAAFTKLTLADLRVLFGV
ncbi:transcription termination factor 2 isoform X2 [Ambystoma mexicanum]|uniref:transcription termination factor 2 isoform X2 n=1 Tax=Ambystoma mexicanum TaxID=8296 RepID=UPI0037E86780